MFYVLALSIGFILGILTSKHLSLRENKDALGTSLTICIAFCEAVVLLVRVFSSKIERNGGHRKSAGNLDEKRCKNIT